MFSSSINSLDPAEMRQSVPQCTVKPVGEFGRSGCSLVIGYRSDVFLRTAPLWRQA